jgi:hypothetical protein
LIDRIEQLTYDHIGRLMKFQQLDSSTREEMELILDAITH